ncbi:M23 family metallopeptidase [Desertifilum sp. FACHB-1129]|uniref:Peptidase M23 n=3 Tax=Desertifilum TaxID=1185872 RepID=A0A1E5QHH1_9CYAN|nr:MULTISPECIES: M23 family metallopeptidase [Desertifilum]MDA0209422.1 M23 family metallopeptidase [Cyanobacteria bacterium FC1]MBD2315118.1 M23 family metallopeptidase [Desertifilum sp. FACHB-1129]MBD2324578.1 M23 family metallopeptidase [Desertifilum sp. FACHB-866]MBD2334669.1 M23 family metallopeptidase [Desertifilum sp. FACHB-868]OEJ74058.1 peptidase M23 [Desertifilum tharense IPPAS B-1220]
MMWSLKKYLFLFLLTLGLASLTNCVSSPPQASNPPASGSVQTPVVAQVSTLMRFAQPIDCTVGKDCYILRYYDRDPGPGEIDFACGRLTGDGHNGTDFGISDERLMAKGVPVLASAPGTVLRMRDNVADERIRTPEDLSRIEGINCGNGMVIDHGNGWETQYCHLRRGSVAVKPGDRVETGTVLGLVGLSGETSFPHVHLTVRHNGETVDPFVGPGAGPGCQVRRNPIWNRSLEYIPGGLIRAGFSDRAPDMEAIWQGQFSETRLSKSSEALVFWVQAYGILAGDVETMRVIDPKGNEAVKNQRSLTEPRRLWLSFSGKRNNPNNPVIPGKWRGEYRLTRGDRTLINITREVEVL